MNLVIIQAANKKTPRQPTEHLPNCYSIVYGDEVIRFTREDRASNVQRILIQVRPDCSVIVQAPSNASQEALIAAVKKRVRWIYSQLNLFKLQLEYATPRQFISGESHYYLGKQYVLKVIEINDLSPCVKLLRGKIEVYLPNKNHDAVKNLLDIWYKKRAKDMFQQCLESITEQTLWVESLPPLRVQRMQKQWGNCSPNGRLTLNIHLIKAPRECINYVILHELCHLAEHNHSQKFYRLMTQVMPNWKEIKTKLDNMVHRIF